MLNTLTPETQQQLQQAINLLKKILGTDLLGVYLYGSALVGGLQQYSDIDLLVVSKRSTTLEERKQLATELLQISGVYMKSTKLPLEMTIVVKDEIQLWRYPPQFDFQYGDWLRADFTAGNTEPWEHHDMPDLALIITQVLLKSETLFGLDAKQLLPEVPYQDFINAMVSSIDSLAADLDHDTRNVLLTFARIWSTLKTNAIRSKPDAADWAIDHLPKEHQIVMQRAKFICMGFEVEHWDDIKSFIKPCSDLMIEKIHEGILLINFDDLNHFIRLA